MQPWESEARRLYEHLNFRVMSLRVFVGFQNLFVRTPEPIFLHFDRFQSQHFGKTANRQINTKFQATSPALRQEGDESHVSRQEPILRMSTFHCAGLAWTRCRMSYDSYDPMIRKYLTLLNDCVRRAVFILQSIVDAILSSFCWILFINPMGNLCWIGSSTPCAESLNWQRSMFPLISG